MELLLDELKRRRMALINEMPDNSIAILSSANKISELGMLKILLGKIAISFI